MSEITRKTQKTVVDEKLIGIRCDICGKEIEHSDKRLGYRDKSLRAVRYAECYHNHYDWGNDSCESYDYSDVCLGCLGKWLDGEEKYLAENNTGHISVTMVTKCISVE